MICKAYIKVDGLLFQNVSQRSLFRMTHATLPFTENIYHDSLWLEWNSLLVSDNGGYIKLAPSTDPLILTDCILDERVTNLDAPSHSYRKQEAVLLSHERDKKKNYLQACQDQRRHCSAFVVSCDGVLGNEAKVQLYPEKLCQEIGNVQFRNFTLY